jgi:hypothetical protein
MAPHLNILTVDVGRVTTWLPPFGIATALGPGGLA